MRKICPLQLDTLSFSHSHSLSPTFQLCTCLILRAESATWCSRGEHTRIRILTRACVRRAFAFLVNAASKNARSKAPPFLVRRILVAARTPRGNPRENDRGRAARSPARFRAAKFVARLTPRDVV